MQEITTTIPTSSRAPVVYMLFAVAGLSFCFFLGFPFDNHNESYNWIPVLNSVGFWDTITTQVIKIESFRPFGMANAWLSYKLSGNIYLQQLLNWLFAIASFLLLYREVSNKLLFALMSFITGACFFSGYIYLFHLHGVFYGPFQLYTAALAITAWRYRQLPAKILALLLLCTVVACFYHTFALLIFCALLTGYMFQVTADNKKTMLIRLSIAMLLSIVLGKMILDAKEFKGLQAMTEGFLVSYKMAEINRGLSLVSLLLATFSAFTLSIATNIKKMAIAATVIAGIIMIYLKLPVLILWITLCLIQLLTKRNMAMAAVVAAAAILPLGSGSGSPTYVIFVLMLCAFTAASASNSPIIPDLPFTRKLAAAAIAALVLCLLALKSGKQLPMVSAIARPILAEQEKTIQLRKIIDWKRSNTQYATFALRMYDASGLPVQTGNSLSRANRPVVGQDDLDVYLDFLTKDIVGNASKAAVAWITFGDKLLPGKELIFAADGKWNGKAMVFK